MVCCCNHPVLLLLQPPCAAPTSRAAATTLCSWPAAPTPSVLLFQPSRAAPHDVVPAALNQLPLGAALQWAEPSKVYQRLSLLMRTQAAGQEGAAGGAEEEKGVREYSLQACVGVYRQILIVRADLDRSQVKDAMKAALKAV
jgi:hypothetical protein